MSCLITGTHNEYTKIFSDIIVHNSIKLLYYDNVMNKIKKNNLQRLKIIFVLNDEEDNKKKINDFLFELRNHKYQVQILYVDIKQIFNEDNHFIFQFNELLNLNFELSTFEPLKNVQIQKDKNNKHNTIQILPKIHTNVIICGVCKDIEKYSYTTLNKFLYLTHFFTQTSIIIYENDSKDKTVELLNKFQSKYKKNKIIILTENNIKGSRTEKIAHGRNTILNYIDDNELNPDYLIQLDMDEILQEFQCVSILEPFKENINWSMFGGNSKIYYDMWALRTMDFPYFDFWKLEDLTREERMKYYFKIAKDSKPIKVFSCFNGIGIYKYKHTRGCRYDGKDTCEHVIFHKKMIKKHNANLFIHPKLMVGPHKILSKPMEDEINNVKKVIKDIFFK